MTQLPVFEGGNRTLDEAADSRLRLQTIVRLRWFAIIGQTLAVAVVALLFRFPMPVGYCLAFITLSAWLNVYLRVRYTARHRLSATFATVLLGYDVLQLAALLYLTGGIENPFIVLMVAPVTVSAATLPPRNTILLGALALAAAGLLTTEHMALPWDGGVQLSGPLALPMLYKLGVLLAFACSLIFLALYAWRLSKESRQMSAALSATEMVLAHEQKLHALDGLAAAAAHELGTPLATIVLVTKELARELPPSSPHGEDIELLRSQAQRCREILQKLTRHPSEQDPMHAAITVTQLLDEVVDPLRASKADDRDRRRPGDAAGGGVRWCAGAGRGAQSGRALRSRQPARERCRFRAVAGRGHRPLERPRGDRDDRRRRPRLLAGDPGDDRRALCHDAACRPPGRRWP